MLRPVGHQSPAVYWRRRLMALVLVALGFLTLYAVLFHHGASPKATAGASTKPRPSASTVTAPVTPPTSPASQSAAAVGSSTGAHPSPSTPAPRSCVSSQLAISAATDARTYPVGATPKVSIVVIDKGPSPCVADLSDKQIVLRVLSGTAPLWGSHDCAVQPGSSLQTLPVGQPVRREIQWSGLTSEPGCGAPRQRVPAGTYSLTATLAGVPATPATFSLTS